jgi:hypothetical protein
VVTNTNTSPHPPEGLTTSAIPSHCHYLSLLRFILMLSSVPSDNFPKKIPINILYTFRVLHSKLHVYPSSSPWLNDTNHTGQLAMMPELLVPRTSVNCWLPYLLLLNAGHIHKTWAANWCAIATMGSGNKAPYILNIAGLDKSQAPGRLEILSWRLVLSSAQ